MAEYNLGKVKGADGNGIKDITKTDTVGLNDIYTITMDDDTEYTFIVTNGQDGSAGDIDDNVTQNSPNPVKSSGIYTALASKQATLVSGTNIKTINNNSLLGSGNLDIQGSNVDIVTSWESTLSDSKVASEKLVKNTIDTKQATLVSGTNIKTINNNSLLGSGNINIGGGGVDIVTSWESTLSDTKVPSEKLTKNTIDNLNIPTKISDLTNDSDFIETSSTSGLIKNDGTVMTSGTGSTNYSAGNHTHSGYVSATKVTSWSSTTSDSNVPSEKLVKDTIDAIEDLIGDAIDYINM